VVCLPKARSFEVSGEATARIIRAMTPAVCYEPADARLRIGQAPEDVGGYLLVRYKDGSCDAVTYYLMGVNSLIYSINGEMVFRWYEDESDLADEHEEIYHHRGRNFDEALFFTGLLKECFAELGDGP